MKSKSRTVNKKQVIEIALTKKILGKATEHHHFKLQDGRALKTIYELIDELETMEEETFKHHVTEAENHFANWIEHVFEEKNLADEIRHVREKFDTQRALLKHIVRELLVQKRKK